MSMRVLITGGAGYIGSCLVPHLLTRGFTVTVFDKLLFGAEPLLPNRLHPSFRLVKGDVRDGSALRAAMAEVDAVVHLAAIVGEDACAIDEAASWSINYGGTEAVIAAARAKNVERLIFISTCSNYGVSAANSLASEDSTLNPLTHYARSKVEAERCVLGTNAPPTRCVLRLGTICGIAPRMRFDLLISDAARAAATGRPIEIFAPDAWRPFLHVRDAARVIELCLEASARDIDGLVFNVVGENVQKRQIADMASRHFPLAAVVVTDRKPDLRDYRVDATRIASRLGYRPERSVEDAFTETAEAVLSGMFRDPMWPGYAGNAFLPEMLGAP